MSDLLFPLLLLACPVGMGAMMWWMSRNRSGAGAPAAAEQAELIRMQAEIDQLRAAQRDSAPGTR